MTANMIIKFFETYGWIMTLLATSGIVFVGCLKAIGVFAKLKSGAKKYVYFATACVVSIISCTIYLCVRHLFVWADWGVTVLFIIAYTMALYALYENTGLRALLKKLLFNPVKNVFKKIQSAVFSKSLSREQTINIAKGLGEDVLKQLIDELSSLPRGGDDINKDIVTCEAATDVIVAEASDITDKPKSKYQKSNFFS